jgi:hypothetical protein
MRREGREDSQKKSLQNHPTLAAVSCDSRQHKNNDEVRRTHSVPVVTLDEPQRVKIVARSVGLPLRLPQLVVGVCSSRRQRSFETISW